VSVELPSRPGQAAERLVARAAELVPALRERQSECEALGRMPDATVAELSDAGFYRILQPRRFGGYELDIETFSRVVIELSRGCPSTGWAFAFAAGHMHLLASLFSEECQAEVFAGRAEVRMPGNIRPQPAVPVDGGFLVSGAWDYVSGCDSATHFLLGLECQAVEGRDPIGLTAVIDAGTCAIVDNWDMHGLRGTGSKRVVTGGVLVPEHRTIRSLNGNDARLYAATRDRPGRTVHSNPLYSAGGIFSVLFGECVAVAVGIARGALDLYEQTLATRPALTPPSGAMMSHPQYLRCFGEALGCVDVAQDALLASDRDHLEWSRRDVEDGEPFSAVLEQRLILRKLQCARLCAEAVDLMVRTGGTSNMRRGTAMERLQRDMTTLMTHPTVQLEACAELYGQLYFGPPPAWP
jgi:3-hydroxy-9,10-secoandrosta-1,3,5(10)-triene-9,17-dione monooxygenase